MDVIERPLKLGSIPKELLQELKEFFNDKSLLSSLMEQLEQTGIIIEFDEYQITVQSNDELIQIKDTLNKLNL